MSGISAPLGTAFALALVGGVHCAAMCGGFVSALQLRRPAHISAAAFALAYHAGRITGYMAAGVLAGLIGARLFALRVLPLQIGLLITASVLLAAIASCLLGSKVSLRWLEPLGGALWRAIGPWAKALVPPRSLPAAVLAGFAWGWIPCGMVYAALPLAFFAGSALGGAVVLLAFGLGTLPNLLALDYVAARLSAIGPASRLRAWLRPAAGLFVLLFAVSNLAQAARLAGADATTLSLLASLCHSGG